MGEGDLRQPRRRIDPDKASGRRQRPGRCRHLHGERRAGGNHHALGGGSSSGLGHIVLRSQTMFAVWAAQPARHRYLQRARLGRGSSMSRLVSQLCRVEAAAGESQTPGRSGCPPVRRRRGEEVLRERAPRYRRIVTVLGRLRSSTDGAPPARYGAVMREDKPMPFSRAASVRAGAALPAA